MREGAVIDLMRTSSGRLRTCATDGSVWLSDGTIIIRLSCVRKICDEVIDMKLLWDVKFHTDAHYPLVWHRNGIVMNKKILLQCGNSIVAVLDKFIDLFPKAEYRAYFGGDIAIYEKGRLVGIIPSYRLSVEEQEVADKLGDLLDDRMWFLWSKKGIRF